MRSFLKIFSFYGRSNRAAYWIYFLISFVSAFLIFPLFELLMFKLDFGNIKESMRKTSPAAASLVEKVEVVPLGLCVALAVIAGLLLIALYVAWLAISVRRLHDMGTTGWLVLIFVVLSAIGMYLGYVVSSLVLGIWPSSRRNRYGPSPRTDREMVSVFDDPRPASSV